jgi:hypothetical protein
MKGKYRIYVLGEVPADIKERIVAIHAFGILKGKGIPVHTQVLIDKDGATGPSQIPILKRH